jgi:hypothetical protein
MGLVIPNINVLAGWMKLDLRGRPESATGMSIRCKAGSSAVHSKGRLIK